MHLEGVLIEDQFHDTLLYAGSMTVRITDWFIFKKEAELKSVALEDAIIKFQRTDSVWRQQFIFDYFASPKKDTAAKKKAGIVFNLKKVHMKNVLFVKNDGWLGQDMSVRVGTMDLDANAISLASNVYDINTLNVVDPVVALRNYTGRKPKDSVQTLTEMIVERIDSVLYWNKGGTEIRVANLKIVNGTFKNDRENGRDPYAHFDGQHILFTNINADMNSAGFIGDTIYSNLKLSAKERSGFELKQLTADMKFMPDGMAFRNMDLQTNRSRIRDFFQMSYNDMSDMSDFIHKVKMAAVFDDTYIDSDDIAFFAPGMKSWKKQISIEGKVRGTVSDMVGRDMIVQAGNSTMLNGDITLTGLPDINQTFIDIKANELRTTYADATTIIPAVRKITEPDLRKLGFIRFTGSFTGFIRDFVTYGTIQTNLGTVKSDLNMKLPRGRSPIYSGSLETDNFRLGEFLSDPKLGMISMTGNVKGTGFTPRDRNTAFDGVIRFVDYNSYRYSNISVNGKLDKNLFEGVASIRDENLDLDLNGIMDFNGADNRFDLVADVTKANLQALNLLKEDYRFRGHFDLDFTNSSIMNFAGDAKITDAEITKNGKRLPFDSLIVRSVYTDSGRTVIAASNEFDAKITGDFSLREIPDAFSYVLNRYYPAYIKRPAFPKTSKAISFDINTYYVDEYMQLIDSSITGFNNSHIAGNLDLASNTLNLNANIPQFGFKQYNFNNVDVKATGNSERLLVTGSAYNITLLGNDSLAIPVANFSINARNDSSHVNLVTEANRNLDTANLNALVLTYSDGVKIEFDRSTFTLNGKVWTIDENGELAFRRRTPVSGQLQLTEGEQRIVMRTLPSTEGNWNDLRVELTKINMGDISPFILPKNRLEGLLTGNILVEDPANKMRIHSDDIQTQFLRLDNDSIGELRATLDYDNATRQLIVKGNTLNQENFLGFDVNVNLDKARSANNLIALKARNYHIGILERFLGTLFTDMRVYLTGDIDLRGDFQNLAITGKGRLKDAGLKVVFTQVFYDIQDTDIQLTPSEINLDGIILTDTITGNPVYITGGIEHESFRNMFYNLDISTRKPGTTNEDFNQPVQLLNTSLKNNKQFYGNVKGTGSLSLLGPQANMFMKIDAIASETDSSSVTIPPASSRVSGGSADFLVERKYGREMTDIDFSNNATNITYDVDVTANPMVTVKFVLDELTGDEIKGKGSGTLNIRSGTSEPLSLRGRFDIQEGNYLFTFQSFLKKPFELRKGTENYIEWNGDPNEANIRLEALYKAERVSFATLTNSLGLSENLARARGDVYVIAKLGGQLFKPTINFSLDFPETSPAVTSPELALSLQQMQRNTNELNTQVTYLIVFNSFAPVEGSVSSGDSPINIGGTISGIFLNVISEQLNKLFGNLLQSEKYDIRINTSIYNRNLGSGSNINLGDVGSNVNFSINRAFFNNRFIVSTGIGLDAPLTQSSIQPGVQFLPDVQMEWLINPAGTLRAIFFYRENTDYLAVTGPGKAKKYGASFAYRKDVDRLSDLFRDIFRRKKPKVVDPPPPPATTTEQPKTEVKGGDEIKKEEE